MLSLGACTVSRQVRLLILCEDCAKKHDGVSRIKDKYRAWWKEITGTKPQLQVQLL
jgi:hypothetical protein